MGLGLAPLTAQVTEVLRKPRARYYAAASIGKRRANPAEPRAQRAAAARALAMAAANAAAVSAAAVAELRATHHILPYLAYVQAHSFRTGQAMATRKRIASATGMKNRCSVLVQH
jgi:hypothetical protein